MRPVPRGARNTRRPPAGGSTRKRLALRHRPGNRPRPFVIGWVLCGEEGSAAFVQIKGAAGSPLERMGPRKRLHPNMRCMTGFKSTKLTRRGEAGTARA